MLATLNDNEEADLTWDDALEYLGKNGLDRYLDRRIARHERVGQAWFMSLSVDDQDKLRGSYIDPFQKDSRDDVVKALRFLLEN